MEADGCDADISDNTPHGMDILGKSQVTHGIAFCRKGSTKCHSNVNVIAKTFHRFLQSSTPEDDKFPNSESGSDCVNDAISMHWTNGGVEEDHGRSACGVASVEIVDRACTDIVDSGAMSGGTLFENNPSLDPTKFNIVFVNDTIKFGGMHTSVEEGFGTDTTIATFDSIDADIVTVVPFKI